MKTAETVTRVYSIPDEELTEWERRVYNGYNEDQAEFIAFSPVYNQAYGAGWKAKIDLSDSQTTIEEQRAKMSKTTQDVLEAMEQASASYLTLKHFVSRAYKDNLAMQKSFGLDLYDKARKDQQKMLKLFGIATPAAEANKQTLFDSGYTQDHLDTLTATGPVLKDLNDIQESFKKKSLVTTQERIKVMNEAYLMTRDICEAGKIIFAKNRAKYEMYLLPEEKKAQEETPSQPAPAPVQNP